MSVITHDREVGASPAAVWKRLADFGRIGDWAGAVDHSSMMTSRAEGIGASRRIQTGSVVVLENVIEWEPEAVLAYEFVGLPPVVSKVVNRWTLEPAGDRTRVTLTVDVTPGPRPPMRIAARGVARRLAGVNRTLLDDLAAALEGDTP